MQVQNHPAATRLPLHATKLPLSNRGVGPVSRSQNAPLDVYILALKPSASVSAFLHCLRANDIKPIIQARVVPSHPSTAPLLIGTCLLSCRAKPSSRVTRRRNLQRVGPSPHLLIDFVQRNKELLNPPPGSVKPPAVSGRPTARSSQSLELSPELLDWIDHLPDRTRTLLSFNPNQKQNYLK